MQILTLKTLRISVILCSVAACDQPAIWATGDSNAGRLKVGMSSGDVLRILGSAQFQSINDDDPSTYCRSYIYDETLDAKFAHVMFVDNKVVSARDNFRTACEI